jgi:hypothetical protein
LLNFFVLTCRLTLGHIGCAHFSERSVAAAGLLACLAALVGVAILPEQPIMLVVAIALIAVVWNAVGGALLPAVRRF